jgi:hypothetical protein
VGALRRGLGWGLLVFGAIGLLGAVASPASGADYLQSLITVLLGTLVLVVAPGLLLLRSGRRAGQAALRRERLIGLCRSTRWVAISDLCRELRLPEAQAREFLERAIARQEIDLVYVQDEERYLSRADLAQMRAVPAGHCPSCDAPHPARRVLSGERCACDYCGGPLLPDGSAQSA